MDKMGVQLAYYVMRIPLRLKGKDRKVNRAAIHLSILHSSEEMSDCEETWCLQDVVTVRCMCGKIRIV